MLLQVVVLLPLVLAPVEVAAEELAVVEVQAEAVELLLDSQLQLLL